MSRELPNATVGRLPRYLRLLDEIAGETVSSAQLAAASGVTAANVRRDLSHLGFHGVRGVGYSVPELRDRVRRELGLTDWLRVAIVGAGNLGRALANYGGFRKRGFVIGGVYDVREDVVGRTIGSGTVRHLNSLEIDASTDPYDTAILAVPALAAQEVADRLVAAGVNTILNFAPTSISVPKTVKVRQVDLSTELQILSYYRSRG